MRKNQIGIYAFIYCFNASKILLTKYTRPTTKQNEMKNQKKRTRKIDRNEKIGENQFVY